MFLHAVMIVAGLIGIVWGLTAAHRLRRPFDIIGAFSVLTGVIVALLGVLLLTVPQFFYG